MTDEMNVQTSTEETTNELIIEDIPIEDEIQDQSTETEQSDNGEQIDQETENKPTIKVKYNGAEQELSYQDAVIYAQKGMNYDKLMHNYETLKNSPERQIFERQAQSLGMNVKEYAQYLDNFQVKSLENKALQQLQQAYPNENAEVLQQLAKLQVQDYLRQKQAQEYQKEQERLQREEDLFTNQVERFLNAYPNVDAHNLPQEVLEYMLQGEELLSAYRAYENDLLRNKLTAVETNEKNRQKAVGGLANDNAGETENDPFLQGLFGK